MCFFRKKREEKKALQEEQLKMQQESLKKETIVGERPAPSPVVKEVKVESVVVDEVKKVEPKKVEGKKVEPKVEVKEELKVAEDAKIKKYHVSQNKDAKSDFHKQWRVRKEGSSKTIKYFETQAEAIVFAQDLADKNNTSIVIHKLDGSIRKQEY